MGNEIPRPDPKEIAKKYGTDPFGNLWGNLIDRIVNPSYGYLTSEDNPFPIGQNALLSTLGLQKFQPPKGSNLSRADALLGISGEGQQYTNPKGVAKAQAQHDANVREEYAARELKDEMKKENPDTEKIQELRAEIEDAKEELANLKEGGGGGSRGGIEEGEKASSGVEEGEKAPREPAAEREPAASPAYGGGGRAAEYVQGAPRIAEYVQPAASGGTRSGGGYSMG
jgi:hypothetical protein